MVNLEERVTQVENDLKVFRSETIMAYQEFAMHFTYVKGLAETSVGELAIIRTTQAAHSRKLEAIDAHLGMLQGQANRTEKHLKTFEQNVNSRFENFEQNVNARFETQQRFMESFEQNVNARFEEQDNLLKEHSSLLKEHGNLLKEQGGKLDRLEGMLAQVLARLPEKQ